jgi:hypothetical protein
MRTSERGPSTPDKPPFLVLDHKRTIGGKVTNFKGGIFTTFGIGYENPSNTIATKKAPISPIDWAITPRTSIAGYIRVCSRKSSNVQAKSI